MPITEGLRAYLLGKQVERDPAKADDIIAQLNVLKEPLCKLYAEVEVGIAVAASNPALAEQLYQSAKPAFDGWLKHYKSVEIKDIDGLGRLVDGPLHIITLAGLLHKKDDVKTMLAGLEAHLGAAGYSDVHLVSQLFDAAARVSPEFVMDVYHAFAPNQGFNKGYEVACSVPIMAERDPLAALRLIKMLSEAKISDMSGVDLLPIIAALGKKDPAAALTLAKAYPGNYLAPGTLLAAADYQPKAEAKAIITAVFSEEKHRTVGNLAKVYAVNPELAKALYPRYKTQLEAEIRQISENVTEDVQAYQNSAERCRLVKRYRSATGAVDHRNGVRLFVNFRPERQLFRLSSHPRERNVRPRPATRRTDGRTDERPPGRSILRATDYGVPANHPRGMG